jgi:hypothetical protein
VSGRHADVAGPSRPGVHEPSEFTGRQSARLQLRSSPDSNMKMGGMATVASRGPPLRPGRGWQAIHYTPMGIVSL